MGRCLLLVVIACGTPSAPPPQPTNQSTRPTLSVRDEVLAINPHVIVMKAAALFPEYREVMAKARALDPIVEVVAPFVLVETVASAKKDVTVALRCDDEAQIERLLRLETLITSGSVAEFAKGGEPAPLILGRGLAGQLGVKVGDALDLEVPGEKRSVDFDTRHLKNEPLVRSFRVVAILQLALGDFDKRIAFTTLAAGQALNERGDNVQAIGLRLKDPDRADDIAARLERELGGMPYDVQSWNDLNRNVLSP